GRSRDEKVTVCGRMLTSRPRHTRGRQFATAPVSCYISAAGYRRRRRSPVGHAVEGQAPGRCTSWSGKEDMAGAGEAVRTRARLWRNYEVRTLYDAIPSAGAEHLRRASVGPGLPGPVRRSGV